MTKKPYKCHNCGHGVDINAVYCERCESPVGRKITGMELTLGGEETDNDERDRL